MKYPRLTSTQPLSPTKSTPLTPFLPSGNLYCFGPLPSALQKWCMRTPLAYLYVRVGYSLPGAKISTGPLSSMPRPHWAMS